MVFSFFKKTPEKMLVRPPAVPVRPAEKGAPAAPVGADAAAQALPAGAAPSVPTVSSSPAAVVRPAPPVSPAPAPATAPRGLTQPAAATAPSAAPVSSGSGDFTDFSFSDAAGGVLVEDAIDPVDADAEQGAMLWANAQVEAARAFLADSVRTHRFGPGERLWLMLFDLYRLTGRVADFEALGIDYAQAFEKSPPIWRGAPATAAEERPLPAGRALPLSGALLGSDAPALQAIAAALKKSPRIAVDLGALAAGDAAGHAQLLALLAAARRAGGDIAFVAAEALAAALARWVAQGRAAGAESWLLLLELLQQLGREQEFEDTAIDYAVTFEISPPSWERRPLPAGAAAKSTERQAGKPDGASEKQAEKQSGKQAEKQPEKPPGKAPENVTDRRPETPTAGRESAGSKASASESAASHAINAADGDLWRLAGDLRNVRFGELPRFAEGRDSVLIDCTRLDRIDFVSAGALFNTLESLRRAGKRVIFREPNHLVSELLAVFGVPALAEIVSSKR